MSAISPTLKFDDTLGAVLIGGLVAIALWGTACLQTYAYFMHSFKDPWYMKLLVAFLWFLDMFDSLLVVHILYFYMVINYSNPLALYTPIWSISAHAAAATVTNFLIRTMFVEKVFLLSNRNIWLTTWLMGTSLTDLVVSLVGTVKAFNAKTFSQLNTFSSVLYLSFALGIGSDLILAVTLCLLFRRSRTGFQRTDSMISVLVIYTVNTGMIVALNASLVMITYGLKRNTLIYLGIYLSLNKLYLNAYLASLNARANLRFRRENIMSIHLSQISQCRYAVGNPSPIIDKENNDMVQADPRRMSESITTEYRHDEIVNGRDPSSTVVYRDGLPCAA